MRDNKNDNLVDLRRERGLASEEENFSSDRRVENNQAEDQTEDKIEKIRVNASEVSLEQAFSENRKSKTSPRIPFGKDKRELSGRLDGAIKKLLYLLAFLLPIFVLPFSMEIYEFNKILLLFIISGLAFLLWLAKMILIDRKIEIVRTPLDRPIAIFIFLVLVSTAFSVDKASSVLGFYGRFSDSLLVYLSLAMVYFVGVNVIGNSARTRWFHSGSSPVEPECEESVKSASGFHSPGGTMEPATFTNNLIRAFLASSFIVVTASLIYSFGFKFIPWDEAGFRSFNFVGGSLNILAIYLAAVILIALGWRASAASVLSKHLMSSLIVMSLVLLTMIDFIPAWIVLAVCLVLVLGLMGAGRWFHSGSSPVEPECESASGLHSPKGTMEPAASRDEATPRPYISTGVILLISIAFIATSLTALNDNVQSNLESSLISSSVKNRLISSGDGQSAQDGFTREVILDKNTAVSITMAGLKSVKSDPISVAVGSGPGTYLYNFSKFKPAEFNNGVFWNLRFDKAGSEILEKVSTLGVFGILSYLAIIVLAMGMFLKMMFRKDLRWFHSGSSPVEPECETSAKRFHSPIGTMEPASFIYLFAAWFGLLLFQFLYIESITIKFIFCLLTVILAAEYCANRWFHSGSSPVEPECDSAKRFHSPGGTMEPTYTLNFKKEPSAFYSSLLALLVVTLAFGYFCYSQINFYQADAIYKKARMRQNEALRNPNLTREQAWEVLDQGAADLERAVEKNSRRGEYKIYLSDIYLNRASIVFQEENQKGEGEKDDQKIAVEVKNTIDRAKSAADASPNSIVFRQKLAALYADLAKNMGVAGANDWAVKTYQEAIKLEPTNPFLRAELGRAYSFAKKTDFAISELEKALELKENHLDAGFQLGMAYEVQEDNQKAIDQLSSLGSVERMEAFIASGQIVGPNNSSVDIDIAFQLGRIYYNEGETGKAKNIFLKITKVNPTHSNAHYSLGLIYEKEGNDEMALKEFEIVLTANPGNEEVKGKVNKLKGTGDKIIEKEEEIKEETEE